MNKRWCKIKIKIRIFWLRPEGITILQCHKHRIVDLEEDFKVLAHTKR